MTELNAEIVNIYQQVSVISKVSMKFHIQLMCQASIFIGGHMENINC